MDKSVRTEEDLLLDTFECTFVGKTFPSVFNEHTISPENKEAILHLVHSGEPLGKAMGRYIQLVGADHEAIRSTSGMGKNSPRYKTVTSCLQCLVGMPEHKDAVMAYILANLEQYTRYSRGMFGDNYNRYMNALDRPLTSYIANFCRDADDKLLSPEDLDRLVISEHDAHALVVSAVANYDKEAIEQLFKSKQFTTAFPRYDALAMVGELIRQYPAWNLEPALGGLFEQKTNSRFMFETNRLLNLAGSTEQAFRDAFWAGADPMAINDLVRALVSNDKGDIDSFLNCLKVFAENGVDLYPGLLFARQGLGALLDSKNDGSSQQSRSFYVIEAYLNFSQNGKKPKFFGGMLIGLPTEDLVAHPKATDLLFERYRLTSDKSLLRLGNKAFNGKVLQDELGM